MKNLIIAITMFGIVSASFAQDVVYTVHTPSLLEATGRTAVGLTAAVGQTAVGLTNGVLQTGKTLICGQDQTIVVRNPQPQPVVMPQPQPAPQQYEEEPAPQPAPRHNQYGQRNMYYQPQPETMPNRNPRRRGMYRYQQVPRQYAQYNGQYRPQRPAPQPVQTMPNTQVAEGYNDQQVDNPDAQPQQVPADTLPQTKQPAQPKVHTVGPMPIKEIIYQRDPNTGKIQIVRILYYK